MTSGCERPQIRDFPYLSPTIRKILAIATATTLVASVCSAQTSSTTTTTNATGATQSTSTTTEASGTITDFTPGASLVLSTGSGEPTHYRFSKSVSYVTPSGKVIEASKVRKNSKARVHYIREGSDMVVDKVIVEDND